MMEGLLPGKLRMARAEKGLTLRQAAARTGVAKETLSELERGKRLAQPGTLFKIAQGYGISVRDLMEEPVPLAEAPQEEEAGPSARAEQLWRERVEPEFSEEEITQMVEGLKGSVKHPEAVGWINVLDQIAGSVERTIARDNYSLEEIWDEEGSAVEIYGLFRKVRKRLLRDLEDRAPRLHELLQQADARMKAARGAVRAAYQARREQELRDAERGAGNVTQIIKKFDEQRQEREARAEQYADTGA